MLNAIVPALTEDRQDKRERVAKAAVDAVYGRYCANSIAELEAAVVDLIGVPIEDDDDD